VEITYNAITKNSRYLIFYSVNSNDNITVIIMKDMEM
jgi:hypothetical protein